MVMSAADVATALTASWAAIYVGAVGRTVHGAWSRSALTAAAAATKVTFLRPCAGDEPELATRLARLPRLAGVQLIPGSRTVFAIASETDAAFPALEAARQTLLAGGHDARTLVTGAVGPNRKADQLERALARITLSADERLVFADSDVDLHEVDLPALLAPLGDAAVGASWAAPVEAGPRQTPGDALSHAVLASTLHAFPLLGSLDPGGLVGKLFALRSDVVPVAFAAPSLRRSIGEDHAIGERLVRAGYRLVLTPVLARSQARGRSLETVRDRYRRWLLVVRAQRSPLLPSYPLVVAAGPAWLVTGLVALACGAHGIAVAASVGLLARLVVAFAARRFTGSDLGVGATLVSALRGDALLLGCAGRALVRPTIRWRERELRVGAGGQLVEEGAAAP
jgi:ceramide glucosyltransferase